MFCHTIVFLWVTAPILTFANFNHRDWIIRAQCQAACLKRFGSRSSVSQDSIYDVYRVHRCASDECKQCSNPCDWIFSTPAICQQQCMGEGCRQSCKLLYALKDYAFRTASLKISKHNLTLDPPTVVCKDTPARVPFDGPDIAKLFLRWNSRDEDGNATKSPLVFILSMKGQHEGQPQRQWTVLGKTNFAFLPIQNLTAGGTYKFQVTAVTDDGVVDQARDTPWTSTLPEGAVGDSPSQISLVQQSVSGNSMTATIEWTPGRDPACYYKVYWMTTGGSRYDEEKLKKPLPEPKMKLTGLMFGSNYTVQAYAFDQDFRRSSSVTKSWFLTTNCLQATNNNFTICPPGAPLHVKYDVIGWHRGAQTSDVLVRWEAPRFASADNPILDYVVEWRKIPSIHTRLMAQPHENSTEINGNQTSFIVTGLHMNSVYSFWVQAYTPGGASVPHKLVVTIGSEHILEKNAVVQYDKPAPGPDVMSGDGSANTVMLVIGPSILVIVLVIVIVTRCRRKKSDFSDRKMACLRELNPLYGTSPLVDAEQGLAGLEAAVADEYEISWDCLDLRETVGEGAFGRVVKALVKPGPHNITATVVAVKTLRGHLSSEEEKRDLLLEIGLMKELGQHRNIVSILACSTIGPNVGLVMDYCPLGDLKNYLRKNRKKVYCDVSRYKNGCPNTLMTRFNSRSSETLIGSDSGFCPNLTGSYKYYDIYSKCSRESTSSYTSVTTPSDLSVTSLCGDQTLDCTIPCSADSNEDEVLSETQLLSYAWQIAVGMEYLAQKKYVHRDLAARNVLLYDQKSVKISDFGLTRDVYETSVYKPSSGKRVPYKWMPLEAIFDQTFTTKSDVWSFGVVMWEIMALGGAPYPGMESRELLSLLKNGFRMEKPEHCTDQIYQLMLQCWHPLPQDRPTFTQIRDSLDKMLEASQPYMDLEGNESSLDLEADQSQLEAHVDSGLEAMWGEVSTFRADVYPQQLDGSCVDTDQQQSRSGVDTNRQKLDRLGMDTDQQQLYRSDADTDQQQMYILDADTDPQQLDRLGMDTDQQQLDRLGVDADQRQLCRSGADTDQQQLYRSGADTDPQQLYRSGVDTDQQFDRFGANTDLQELKGSGVDTDWQQSCRSGTDTGWQQLDRSPTAERHRTLHTESFITDNELNMLEESTVIEPGLTGRCGHQRVVNKAMLVKAAADQRQMICLLDDVAMAVARTPCSDVFSQSSEASPEDLEQSFGRWSSTLNLDVGNRDESRV